MSDTCPSVSVSDTCRTRTRRPWKGVRASQILLEHPVSVTGMFSFICWIPSLKMLEHCSYLVLLFVIENIILCNLPLQLFPLRILLRLYVFQLNTSTRIYWLLLFTLGQVCIAHFRIKGGVFSAENSFFKCLVWQFSMELLFRQVKHFPF